MNLKKISTFLLFFIFCFSVSLVFAQKSSKKTRNPKSNKPLKPQPKTISGGVVNGKAKNLVQPVCPRAAKMVNIYGRVAVQILIDTSGKVISANAVSGNPLLHKTCENAALNSTFFPIKVSSEFVRVSGIINYDFLPEKWNWLEIAYSLQEPSYSYYSNKNTKDFFPIGFDEEVQLLEQKTQHYEEIKETVLASIQNKIINNPKESWLFTLGLNLGEIKNLTWKSNSNLQDYAQNIRTLIQTKPENISADFISKLELLVFYIENQSQNSYAINNTGKINKLLTNLEEKFPIYGR